MSFEGNFFANKNNDSNKHPNTVEYENIIEQRDAMIWNIQGNLEKMNFSQSEIEEVFAIVEKNYKLMEEAKKPLINVTANDILNEVEDKTKADAKNISENMLNELRAKIVEIQSRKK